MENWLNRTENLIGKENLEILKNSHVIVFGLRWCWFLFC